MRWRGRPPLSQGRLPNTGTQGIQGTFTLGGPASEPGSDPWTGLRNIRKETTVTMMKKIKKRAGEKDGWRERREEGERKVLSVERRGLSIAEWWWRLMRTTFITLRDLGEVRGHKSVCVYLGQSALVLSCCRLLWWLQIETLCVCQTVGSADLKMWCWKLASILIGSYDRLRWEQN